MSIIRHPITLSVGKGTVRLLSARQALACRAMAQDLQQHLHHCAREDAAALAHNACLAAMCLFCDDQPWFSDGEEALERLTLEDLATVTLAYDRLGQEGAQQLQQLLNPAASDVEVGINEGFRQQIDDWKTSE